MALSEADRREAFERALEDAQKIADFVLRRCNGHDEPFVWHGEKIADSSIEHAVALKEECVDRLVRLRAGAPIGELLP